MAIGKAIRPDGHFALLSDQGDRDALENRPPEVACKHFVVPSTMSPHADLARSPVGLADKVWLEAVGREPGENSPWYRSGSEKAGQERESGRSDIVKLAGPADVRAIFTRGGILIFDFLISAHLWRATRGTIGRL